MLIAQSDTIQGITNHDAEYLIREVFLAGQCFEVFNIELSGAVGQAGTFNNGTASIGLDSGVILSNGNVEDISGPNTESDTSTDYGRPGNDPDLELLSQLEGDINDLGQADLVVLEFDFIPTIPDASFNFVFASEEYCEFALSTFYDTFGFFVSGPGINGPFSNNAENVAVVPNTNSPITARNLNFFNNSEYYINNTPESFMDGCTLGVPPATPDFIAFDGYTVPLTANFTVEPCQTYHLKLVVADRSADGAWDSAIFLEANSFAAGLTSNISSISRGPGTSDNAGLEGCGEAVLIFSRGDSIITNDLVVNYEILASSTATEGVDFSEIPDSVIIPAGVFTDTVVVQLFADNIPEGTEVFTVKLDNPCNCATAELSFSIEEPPPLRADISGRQEICLGEAIELTVTPTSSNGTVTYLWENGDDDMAYNIAPLTTRSHRVTLTDECGQEEVIDTEVIVNAPAATLSGDVTICEGVPIDSFTVQLSGADVYSFDIITAGPMLNYDNITGDSLRIPITQTDVYQIVNLFGDGCPGQADGTASAVEIDINIDLELDTISCFSGNDGNATLIATGGDGEYTYEWTHDANLADRTATELTNISYSALVKDSRNCQETISFVMPQPELLTLNIDTLRAAADCVLGGSLSVNIAGGIAPYAINWSNNDTTLVADSLSAGTYQVTVVDTNNCQESALAGIDSQSNLPPVPVIAPTAQLSCNQESVEIDATASEQRPEFRYHWVDADGDSLALADPLLWTTSTPGLYTLIVTNTLTGCQESATTEVSEGISTLDINIAASASIINCNQSQIALTASESNNHEVNWQWSSSDGILEGNLNSANINALGAGWYYLQAETVSGDCFGLDSVFVNVDTLAPQLQLDSSNSISCTTPGSTLSVNTLPPGNYNYAWSGDGELQGDLSAPTVTGVAAGDYTVTVTNTENGCSNTANTTLADIRTDVQLTPIDDQVINCTTTHIDVQAQVSGGDNFEFYWLNATNDTLARSSNYVLTTTNDIQVIALNTANGCTDNTSFSVQLDTLRPEAIIPLPDVLTCITDTVELTNTTINANWAPQWEDELGNLIGSGNWNQVVREAGTYNLIVEDNTNGCRDTAQTNVVQLDDPPVAILNEPDTLNCITQQVELNVQPQGTSNYTFFWTGPVNGFDGAIDIPTVNATQPGVYTATVRDEATGCTADYSLTLIEDIGDILIDPIPDTSLTCTRTTIELIGSSPTPGNLTYRWLDNQGNELANTATINITTTGQYELEITNTASGCDRSIQVDVTENTETPEVIPAPTLPLTCTRTSSILSINPGLDDWQTHWLNSNGDTLARNQWNFTANEAGLYQLLVTDPLNGCQSSTPFLLDSDTLAPVATVQALGTLNCQDTLISLNSEVNVGSDDYSYQWTGPTSGIISDHQLANVTINQGGLYQLIVTDNTNSCRDTVQTTIVADTASPQLTVPQDTTIDCQNTMLSLQATSNTMAPLSYLWKDESNNIISNSSDLTISAAAIYTVVLTNTNTGCTTTGSVDVSDNRIPPGVDAGAPQTINCESNQATLQGDTGSNNYDISWLNSLGEVLTTNNLQLVVSEPGLYTLEVTNPANGCINTDTVQVSVDQNAPIVQVSDVELDCFTESAILDLTGSSVGPEISYTIFTEVGELVQQSTSPDLEVSTAGNYQLVLANSTNNCTSTASFFVNVNLPVIQEVLVNDPTCSGESGLLEVTSVEGGNAPYLYALEEGAYTPNASFGNLAPGTYNLSVQDANGCEDYQEIVITPASPLELILEEQYSMQLGDGISLNAQVNRDPGTLLSVRWEPADQLSCTDCLNPTVFANQSQAFELTIVDANGCSASIQTRVIVDTRVPVYIPNAISPNGDGNNDTFVVFGDPKQLGLILDMSIFDRWGALVYEQQNLNPNDPRDTWDGTFNGQPLNNGPFVYQFRIELSNGEVISYQGEVLLLR